ncbi:MAG: hypothetical protein ABIM89_05170 [Mycobacteriales bacterium]
MLGSAVAFAVPATAHVVAELSVVSPAEGATVDESVEVVVAAAPGHTESADFTVLLGGALVGRDGTVGAKATFTSRSLRAGERLTVPLRGLDAGRHTLTLRYVSDADSAKPDVTRTFVVGDPDPDNPRSYLWLVGAIVALLLILAVAIRRRDLPQR